MSDSLGQGFTASIVNSVPNYLSSDKSTLGMIDGVTGAIQYVKLVWGASGETNFVSESGPDPSALPVSLNNADNYWLIDSVLNTVHRTASGNTAFRVALDGASITVTGASFSISVGTGVTIVGFAPSATASNLGVTFGGITINGPVRVRNFVSGAGVTEGVQVTGAAYILGGTVAISNQLSLNLNSGLIIAGITAGLTLPVSVGPGGICLGTDQVLVRINSVTPGVTIGVALTTPGGTFFPGAYTGIPVFGVSGATALGVTFGTISTSLSGVTVVPNTFLGGGVLGVTFTGSLSTTISFPATGVTVIHGSTGLGVTFATVGITTTNAAGLGVTFSRVRIVPAEVQSTTFGAVLTDATGKPLGLCGAFGVAGIPVFGVTGATAINVNIVGGFSGINISGVSFGDNFGISGGTISMIRGGTLDFIGKILGFGSAITLGSNTYGAWVVGGSLSANISNSTISPANVRSVSWSDSSGTSLAAALSGLTVNVSGLAGSGMVISGVSLGGGNFGPTGSTYLGVTMGQVVVSNMVALPASFLVEGSAQSRADSPVGVTFRGVFGSGQSRLPDESGLLGISLFGVARSAGALSVSVVGGLSGITVSGISFPAEFGISGGTLSAIRGGTLDFIKSIGFVSGGTMNIGNIVGVSLANNTFRGQTFAAFLTKPDGSLFDQSTTGIPVQGVTNATPIRIEGVTNAIPVGVTWSGGSTVSISNTTLGVTLAGVTIVPSSIGGVLGVTFTGSISSNLEFPVRGVTVFSGTTALGVSLAGVTVVPSNIGGVLGVTFTGSISSSVNLPVAGITVFSGITALGVSLAGVTVVPSNIGGVLGVTFTGSISSNLEFPVRGVTVFSGTTALGVSLSGVTIVPSTLFNGNVLGVSFEGITIRGPIVVTGDASTAIGVTLNGGGAVVVANNVQVTATAGMIFGATFGRVLIEPKTVQGTTFGFVLTNPSGQPIPGGTVGIPVFGFPGATQIGVTFGGITFGGITFSGTPGVTFNVTRTILVGSSFSDGGNNLGVPVYGVAGTTAVRVDVVGGTVSGIFVADAPGITIMGVTTGIPVHGVAGATAVGVTFGTVTSALSFPTTGITISFINSPVGGQTLGISGSVIIMGGSLGIAPNTILQTFITADVPIKAGSEMSLNTGKMLGVSYDKGIIVTEKHGSMFMRGFTLSNLFIQTALVPGGLSFGAGMPAGEPAGGTVFYFKEQPVCITRDYNGPYREGSVNVGSGTEVSVPLKKGLFIQFTKWDLISHVYVGYTAGSTNDFERDAQILHREYQPMPIWGNILNQYKIGNGEAFDDIVPTGFTSEIGPFVGMIEKPTRIFIPCKNAGEVYIKPLGDYRRHTIGAGFWVYNDGAPGATWTSSTLYERSWYASDYAAIEAFQQGDGIGGRPWIDPDGGTLPSIVSFNGSNRLFAGKAVEAILNSYKYEPFVRIWGY